MYQIAKQHKEGIYSKEKAIQDYVIFLTIAADKYYKEFKETDKKFTKSIINKAAQEIEEEEFSEYELGNYTE